MSRAAVSPDLNPIQHTSDKLGLRCRSNNCINNIYDLINPFQQECQRFPKHFIQRYVHSMRRRSLKCIQVKKGHTGHWLWNYHILLKNSVLWTFFRYVLTYRCFIWISLFTPIDLNGLKSNEGTMSSTLKVTHCFEKSFGYSFFKKHSPNCFCCLTYKLLKVA